MPNISAKTIGAIIAGFLGISVLLFGVWKLTSSPTAQQKVAIPMSAADHTTGNNKAPVVLVEYADFQCPTCKAFYPLVKQLTEKDKDKLFFVYKFFPLDIHKHSHLAAQAAEAAGLQNKFFEMHDKLFDHQSDWADSDKAEELMMEYAKELKLDTDKFKSDLNSSAVKDKVEKDLQSGFKAGVNGTPSFFINGYRVQSFPQSLQEFEKLLFEKK